MVGPSTTRVQKSEKTEQKKNDRFYKSSSIVYSTNNNRKNTRANERMKYKENP